jgi:hypothetical protein
MSSSQKLTRRASTMSQNISYYFMYAIGNFFFIHINIAFCYYFQDHLVVFFVRLRVGEPNMKFSIICTVRYHDDRFKKLNAWFIYILDTTFIRCGHTCTVTHIHNHFMLSPCHPILPLAPLLPTFLAWLLPHFTYLEIPFLVIVVRMSIHTRPRLVIDCPPLAPCLPPPLPTVPTVHVTCFQRWHHIISYTVWYMYCKGLTMRIWCSQFIIFQNQNTVHI